MMDTSLRSQLSVISLRGFKTVIPRNWCSWFAGLGKMKTNKSTVWKNLAHFFRQWLQKNPSALNFEMAIENDKEIAAQLSDSDQLSLQDDDNNELRFGALEARYQCSEVSFCFQFSQDRPKTLTLSLVLVRRLQFMCPVARDAFL